MILVYGEGDDTVAVEGTRSGVTKRLHAQGIRREVTVKDGPAGVIIGMRLDPNTGCWRADVCPLGEGVPMPPTTFHNGGVRTGSEGRSATVVVHCGPRSIVTYDE